VALLGARGHRDSRRGGHGQRPAGDIAAEDRPRGRTCSRGPAPRRAARPQRATYSDELLMQRLIKAAVAEVNDDDDDDVVTADRKFSPAKLLESGCTAMAQPLDGP